MKVKDALLKTNENKFSYEPMNHYPIIGMRSLEMHKFRDPSWIFCDLFLEISLETLIAKISGARIFYECMAKSARKSSRRREESKSLPL